MSLSKVHNESVWLEISIRTARQILRAWMNKAENQVADEQFRWSLSLRIGGGGGGGVENFKGPMEKTIGGNGLVLY
jgi:hypothetical protein